MNESNLNKKPNFSTYSYDNPSTRTLTTVGEKVIKGQVKSMNAVTHSYTIMPIISVAGKLMDPVFICLQERTGKLGPRVKQSIYQASHILVTCNQSGKLTKTHIQYWAENVLSPSVSEDCLLMLDSWSGQTDPSIFDDAFVENITCKQMQVPSRTTDDIQPLDRYFFRHWKYFKQKIYDRVAIDQMNIDTCSRNFILKMHSLIHNQLTAKRFSSLIKYAWCSSGYITKDPGHFENVYDVCFSFDDDSCSMTACTDFSFICCSPYSLLQPLFYR